MAAARPGVFVHFSVHFSHVMSTTAPAAIPGRRPFSACAASAHIALGTLHANTAPIQLTSAEQSASHPGCDAHGHARCRRPDTRSAGPVWSNRRTLPAGRTGWQPVHQADAPAGAPAEAANIQRFARDTSDPAKRRGTMNTTESLCDLEPERSEVRPECDYSNLVRQNSAQ